MTLRIYTKFLCLATLFLIFAGGMVTSTGSGLAVPDWPLSYGTLFPPMVGGVFYEHGHRMIASFIGCATLILAIWMGRSTQPAWVKKLTYCALGTVIVQGLLGGVTVLFLLPTPVSILHGVLAQTFFILTVIIAYSVSNERTQRILIPTKLPNRIFLKSTMHFLILIYIQLIFGAIMRHTGSGLAVPDFPTMGGEWIPRFDTSMLNYINDWRFMHNYEPIKTYQIHIHLTHRLMALLIIFSVCFLNWLGLKHSYQYPKSFAVILLIDLFVFIQITLGISTILTEKNPIITSLHVVTGAVLLGLATLLILRTAPVSLMDFKNACKKT